MIKPPRYAFPQRVCHQNTGVMKTTSKLKPNRKRKIRDNMGPGHVHACKPTITGRLMHKCVETEKRPIEQCEKEAAETARALSGTPGSR